MSGVQLDHARCRVTELHWFDVNLAPSVLDLMLEADLAASAKMCSCKLLRLVYAFSFSSLFDISIMLVMAGRC